jgi:ribosomal-protein-alanine N-acetyltransferase
MHQLLSGKDVLRYFPETDPPSREAVDNMILRILSHWNRHGYGLWAVESRLRRELIGRCGLQYLPDTAETEIDFIIAKGFWGSGFATEAGLASLQYGFRETGLEWIVGIAHTENRASHRVLEKLGMKFTGQTEYFGMDCYRYAIERSQVIMP